MTHPPATPPRGHERPDRGGDDPGAHRSTTVRDALEWFVRDPRSGKRVVAQLPNLPILLFIASLLARRFVEDGTTLDTLLAWAGTVALAWWAVDELVRGQSPFRRVLGVGGIVAVVVMVAGRL